jgi:hypothetical protein
MQADPERQVEFDGRQFDHWGRDGDTAKRAKSIAAALDWIATVVGAGSRRAAA